MSAATTARSTQPDVRLPPALYRGDADPCKTRSVVAQWGDGFLRTPMANGGDPFELLKHPFGTSLRRHVDTGWALTHFLSFSTDYDVARRYAAGVGRRRLVQADAHWDTALFTFNLDRVHVTDIREPGVYDAVFPGRRVAMDRPTFPMQFMRWYANHDKEGQLVSILLVDAVTYLIAQVARAPELAAALEKARRDAEWLVLPLDPPLGDDSIDATALLDDALITCERLVSS